MANTAPGCWGPMITPHIKGGHEVTLPTAVSGAEIGDAVAIRIKSITITRQCQPVSLHMPAQTMGTHGAREEGLYRRVMTRQSLTRGYHLFTRHFECRTRFHQCSEWLGVLSCIPAAGARAACLCMCVHVWL